MIKQDKQLSRLAKNVLKTYRLYRSMGFNCNLSRANAHFNACHFKDGRTFLYGQTQIHKHDPKRRNVKH